MLYPVKPTRVPSPACLLTHGDTHSLYYEDQKEESVRRSKDYIANRLPKFLGYFERVLQGKASGDGPWLYAGKLTYADLVLFQARFPHRRT